MDHRNNRSDAISQRNGAISCHAALVPNQGARSTRNFQIGLAVQLPKHPSFSHGTRITCSIHRQAFERRSQGWPRQARRIPCRPTGIPIPRGFPSTQIRNGCLRGRTIHLLFAGHGATGLELGHFCPPALFEFAQACYEVRSHANPRHGRQHATPCCLQVQRRPRGTHRRCQSFHRDACHYHAFEDGFGKFHRPPLETDFGLFDGNCGRIQDHRRPKSPKAVPYLPRKAPCFGRIHVQLFERRGRIRFQKVYCQFYHFVDPPGSRDHRVFPLAFMRIH
mmetsp:Transcript_9826/g.24491  ORF Transcript_9826/g.24491 Transcript_9826/m.24491 type:complete len:278 (-) Transcript_9826:1649-2482(-)